MWKVSVILRGSKVRSSDLYRLDGITHGVISLMRYNDLSKKLGIYYAITHLFSCERYISN